MDDNGGWHAALLNVCPMQRFGHRWMLGLALPHSRLQAMGGAWVGGVPCLPSNCREAGDVSQADWVCSPLPARSHADTMDDCYLEFDFDWRSKQVGGRVGSRPGAWRHAVQARCVFRLFHHAIHHA